MFVLDAAGNVVETPKPRPPPFKPPKLSECSPLFMSVRVPVGRGNVVWAVGGWETCSAARAPACG